MEHLKRQFLLAKQKIETSANALIITHYNPDGDGLSSACAMAEYFRTLHKNYTLFCYTEPPKTFGFLVHITEFKFVESLEGEIKTNLPIDFSAFDLIIILDCGSKSRTKLVEYIDKRDAAQYIIEFDHHPKIDSYADLEIREPLAAATAELVYHFFKANRIRLNKTIANTLITGVITDTANFLYPQTTEMTIDAAADLVRLGAQLPRMTDHSLHNKSLEAMQLWGRIMANLVINPRYNLAITILDKKEFENSTIDKEELEGVSGFLSNLHGVSAVLFLREEGDGMLRGSLRTSHPKVDVSKLARLLGGGGHAKASGFAIKGEIKTLGKGWYVR